MTSNGLLFECNPMNPTVGMVSTFSINPKDTGQVEIVIGPQSFNTYDPTKHQTELAVGFLKYAESWWGLAQGCELLFRRQSGMSYNRRIATKLNGEEINTSIGSFNAFNYAKFTLKYDPSSLAIRYDELSSVGAVLNTYEVSLNPNTPDPEHPYHIVIYGNVTPGCIMQFPVRRTVIALPMTDIQTKERVWFLENPSTYTPPMAAIRDYGPHIYHHSNKILIEDSVIRLGNSYASKTWWNILKYLVNSNLESFIFKDIDGYEFRCIFGELTANQGLRTGQRGPGYELTLPVVVVH